MLTEPSSGMFSDSHEISCCPNAVPVTMRKRSSAMRLTVKSHSMPPRWLRHWVYHRTHGLVDVIGADAVEEGDGPGPRTSILLNEVSSNRPAAARVCRCS